MVDIINALNLNQQEYEIMVEEQKKIISKIDYNNLQMATELNMPVAEYRRYLAHELKKIHEDARNIENKYTAETAYTIEQTYINFNIREINKFMNLGGNITPIGKHSAQIIEDYLYAGIHRITRDVVKEIIGYYKIIDIKEVQEKYDGGTNI